MEHRNIIKMDGDYYRVSIPTRYVWDCIHDCNHQLSLFWDSFPTTIYSEAVDGSHVFYKTSFGGTRQSILLVENKKDNMQNVWEAYQPIRLMLEPLDQDLCSIVDVFHQDNPDGVIVTGGAIKFDISNPEQLAAFEHPVVETRDEFQFLEADSEEESLQWMVCRGFLVSGNVLFRTPIKNLVEWGFVS